MSGQEGEVPNNDQLPGFLRKDDKAEGVNEVNEEANLERDMEFVLNKARGLSTDPHPGINRPDPYAPKLKSHTSLSLPSSSSKFRVSSPEAEEAAVRVAQQAKSIVTQTSSVVRRAIAELQRELKELDDILINHEAQSHQTIDDHLKVSTEVASSVVAIRQNFEAWKSKIEK